MDSAESRGLLLCVTALGGFPSTFVSESDESDESGTFWNSDASVSFPFFVNPGAADTHDADTHMYGADTTMGLI